MMARSDDQRLGDWLRQSRSVRDCVVVLVGFPSDEGVRRNGGRPGASAAPEAIREALYKLTPDASNANAFEALLDRTVDLGDLANTGDLESDQEALGEAIATHLSLGRFVIVLGGGHEVSYGHFLGYVNAGIDVDILNVDAHADVRPLKDGGAHSGSPFRQAIEHDSRQCRRYTVAGLQPHSTSIVHADYVREHGGKVVWRDDLGNAAINDLVADLREPTLATFDIDAVEVASAPGVSAPNAGGLDARTWLRLAYAVGKSPAVASFDIAEMNPSFDIDGRTTRLAALTVWQVLRGLARR